MPHNRKKSDGTLHHEGHRIRDRRHDGMGEPTVANDKHGYVFRCGSPIFKLFFKNRFSKSERQSGITNYVMGLAFITEGAIPFAAADPLHVIPATAVGAAVAGALSMVFGCTLMAPHGGLFVFPVVGNWPMYLVALAAGSVITMFMLALLKKPVYKEN